MINFYETLPKHLQTKTIFDKNTQMKIPYRCLFVSPSGGGKTNTLLNMIHLQSGIFNYIVLVTPNAKEPLYMYLKENIGPDQFNIVEGLANLKPPEHLVDNGHSLVIFDDIVTEKNQKIVEDYFVRARKIGILKGGSVSLCYLSQSFYLTPITIRRNVNYIIINELSRRKDIVEIIKDYSLNTTKEELIKIFDKYTNGLLNFIMIDITAPPDKRLRHNFNEIIKI